MKSWRQKLMIDEEEILVKRLLIKNFLIKEEF